MNDKHLRNAMASLDRHIDEGPVSVTPITAEVRRLRRELEIVHMVGLSSAMTRALWAAARPFLGVEGALEMVRNLLQAEPRSEHKVNDAVHVMLEHRVKHFGLELSQGVIDDCAGHVAEAWSERRKLERRERRAS